MTRPLTIGAADHAPLPRSTEGTSAPSPLNLPIWAKPHASLIADIIAEQPERNKVTTETCMGPASYGYRGRNAARLRDIYALAFARLLTWVGAVEHDSAEYHQRRNALIAFDKANNADAVIARGMGQ